jgi:hypothetical protein
MIIDHLEIAERHIAEGKVSVERQRQVVEKLADDGHQTDRAKGILAQLEELLTMHIRIVTGF